MAKSSAAKNVLFTLILLLVFFLLIEIILSVFFFHKHSDEKLATVEAYHLLKAVVKGQPNPVNVDNQKLVRPDSSEAVNKQIAEETHLSNKFRYESWIEFSNIDYKGKYVNIERSVRKSIPNLHINPASTDTIDIYFFGGSTMFGFNVADSETLPSQFIQLYKQRFPSGRSIRVHNYATPTYYSYQELIQLSNLFFQGHRPDMVVFLDGVNDFWFAKASYYNQSYFSFILRQVFNQDLLTTGKFQFKDSAERMFMDPTDIPLDQYNDRLVSNYLSSIRNAKMMAELAGAKSYFFCQPVPFYKYPNQQKDPICFKDTNTRFSYIYPRIEGLKDSLPNFSFLGDMLQQETGYPFVDGLHYSPGFTRKVAERILATIQSDLQ